LQDEPVGGDRLSPGLVDHHDPPVTIEDDDSDDPASIRGGRSVDDRFPNVADSGGLTNPARPRSLSVV
jgi:hypothetical protein